MRHRGLLLIVFPASLLMLLAAERFSIYLLGFYPSEPVLWRVWLELRPQLRPISDQLDILTGYSLSLQALLLLLAATGTAFALKLRKSSTLLFLINHLALVIAAAGAILAAGPTVAGPWITDAIIGVWGLPAGPQFSWLQISVLVLGTGCCLFCHYVFLAEARQKSSLLAVRLKELQRSF